jgi:hypothetical protein
MALRISDAAMILIRERLSRAGISNGVVRFIEESEPFAVSREAADSIRSGRNPQAPSEEREISMQLVPAVYPRERVSPWWLKEINGVTFEVPLTMRFVHREIDVGAGCLVLRDERGRVLLPQKRRVPGR